MSIGIINYWIGKYLIFLYFLFYYLLSSWIKGESSKEKYLQSESDRENYFQSQNQGNYEDNYNPNLETLRNNNDFPNLNSSDQENFVNLSKQKLLETENYNQKVIPFDDANDENFNQKQNEEIENKYIKRFFKDIENKEEEFILCVSGEALSKNFFKFFKFNIKIL